jgi:hypothetical protein
MNFIDPTRLPPVRGSKGMTERELIDQLRKALRDIDKSRLTHGSKCCIFANTLRQYRDAWRRHGPRELIVEWLRRSANEEERGVT